jgi:iron(III) transport system ATP-binding protein
MTSVRVTDLVVGYGGPPVVREATCSVGSGSLLAVVGASGSGKTTLLRAIAGFVPVTSGTISFDSELVTGPGVSVPPERRRAGIVTQDGSLFPHLSVERNIAFGLPRRELPDGTPTVQRVAELLDLVGLTGLGARAPHELSGGQQQRVALARALAPGPDVVLLDEPFSALDAGLRTSLGHEVRDLLRSTSTTAILVTHDQSEALSLADSVAVMVQGRIVQQGAPVDVYGHPTSLDAASFLGEVVLLPVLGREGDRVITALGALAAGDVGGGEQVVLRPEQVSVIAAAPGSDGRGSVVAVSYHGHDSLVDVRLDDGSLVRARVLGSSGMSTGDRVDVGLVG